MSRAEDTAVEAYHYLFPLVLMDVTRRQMTAGGRHANRLIHRRQYPDAADRGVVRPNFDTLYSAAWLDLTEPVVLSVPEADRYTIFPLYDMWTDVFASFGTRTAFGDFAVVGPGWTGAVPEGAHRIEAPTPAVWLIGRTQTNGPDDYAAVHAYQDAVRLTPVGSAEPEPDGDDEPVGPEEPMRQVQAMSAAGFFSTGCRLLARHGAHPTDHAVLMRMAGIGLRPGPLDEVHPALEAAPATAQAGMRRVLEASGRLVNGWRLQTSGMGVWGNDYARRAAFALIGLGALPVEDAVYPICAVDADGMPLTGDQDYVLRFEADALPPVRAFWSVTVYDQEGYQVPNAIDRFTLGDRDALTYGPDGSLELHVRSEPADTNWLPSPPGQPFTLTMRLYDCEPAVVNGTWDPPPVRRA